MKLYSFGGKRKYSAALFDVGSWAFYPRLGLMKTTQNSFLKTGGFSKVHKWILVTLLNSFKTPSIISLLPRFFFFLLSLLGISFVLIVRSSGKLRLSAQICNHSDDFAIPHRYKKKKRRQVVVKEGGAVRQTVYRSAMHGVTELPAKQHIPSQAAKCLTPCG